MNIQNQFNEEKLLTLNLSWYYVADPMCSWCYAFAPEFEKLKQQYPFRIKYIMGGLAADNNEPMSTSMATQIAGYWKTIEERTGVKFNHDYWQKNTPYRSTYIACRAVISAEILQAGSGEKMFQAIQNAYYLQAKNPSLESTLVECAISIDLPSDLFKQTLNSCATNEQLDLDFIYRDKLGVQGFPSLFLVDDQLKTYPIALGYNTYENISLTLSRTLPNIVEQHEQT